MFSGINASSLENIKPFASGKPLIVLPDEADFDCFLCKWVHLKICTELTPVDQIHPKPIPFISVMVAVIIGDMRVDMINWCCRVTLINLQ
jgi:hypothetical protein